MIVATATMLMCLPVFAQEEKPCLFIGLYDENKRGICSDRAMEQENVSDYAEYLIKKEQFTEAHKTQKPATKFIDKDAAAITYRYEKEIVGWKCNSKVISIKTGKTIESCNQQLADQLAKSPKDFTTPPQTFFTWQGKGLAGTDNTKAKVNTKEYGGLPGTENTKARENTKDYGGLPGTENTKARENTKDYGGLPGTENTKLNEYTKDYGGLSGRFISGSTNTKNITVAKFTNNTKDKRANVLLRTDDGRMTMEYVYPGNTLTKKYNSKKIEIQVQYQDYNAPEPANKVYEFFKGRAWEILTIINGEFKLRKWDPGCMCVRG